MKITFVFDSINPMYYSDKLNSLNDIFGADDAACGEDWVYVKGAKYPIIQDVIILSSYEGQTRFVRSYLGRDLSSGQTSRDFSESIQFSFGEEWKKYGSIMPEHEKEFLMYFDIVDLPKLKGKRVCDLGCGSGRWSYFLKEFAGEIALVDFSDAIFVARKNLAGSSKCLFFMADLKKLPFREKPFSLLFSLGVLHHLPTGCIDEVRALKKFAGELLVFLYYSLDNRPFYFRAVLAIVTLARLILSKIKNSFLREIITGICTYLVYIPLIYLGKMLDVFKLGGAVPLYDFYQDKSPKRIRQDVYDRFFTGIEQRVSRKEILALKDTFSEIIISDKLPYWHFTARV